MIEESFALVTPSPHSFEIFIKLFPQYSYKINYIPYYLPYIQKISQEELDGKYSNIDKIKLIFIGKQAKRKGLDLFLNAYAKLDIKEKKKLQITVISKFLDGEINLPQEFIFHKFVNNIQEELKKNHILIFLSKQEAYGLVLVEAMASGCNVFTTDHPIQRSICNNRGGWFVNINNLNNIVETLKLILNSDLSILKNNALNNIHNFEYDKNPVIVGKKYYNLFKATLEKSF